MSNRSLSSPISLEYLLTAPETMSYNGWFVGGKQESRYNTGKKAKGNEKVERRRCKSQRGGAARNGFLIEPNEALEFKEMDQGPAYLNHPIPSGRFPERREMIQ